MLPQLPLIMGVNAVPLDPAVRFAVGNLLPRPVLRTPDGSPADIMVNASWQNGKWVVEFRRKLITGNAENRYDLISFVQTLGLGEQTAATVRAVRIGR